MVLLLSEAQRIVTRRVKEALRSRSMRGMWRSLRYWMRLVVMRFRLSPGDRVDVWTVELARAGRV